jgi:tripartite-type tricarboxylate transporter receptor subunit TctC
MRIWRPISIALLNLALLGDPVAAQWPPEKPVRIIVPLASGGVGDVLMRLLAQEIGANTNRTIIVENRPGGGTVIGTEVAARASPDGATLLFVANSFLINGSLNASLPYDPLTSFVPICLLARTPFVLVVGRNSPFQTLSQFIAAARGPQGQIAVGATGPHTTQHLAIEALNQASQADLRFLPFGGDIPAINNLLGGHVPAVLANYGAVRAHLGGALQPLAVGSRDGLAELPNVPTFSEAGFDEVDAVAWMGLVAPAKTQEQTTVSIAGLVRLALDAPAIKAKAEALAFVPAGSCGEEFGAFLRQEHERIARLVKAVHMKAN